MATMKHILDSKGNRFWFVSPEDTVLTALKQLAEKKIGAVLVMDGERLRGVFSERDFARLAAGSGAIGLNTPVGKVMTSQVFCVKPDTTVDSAMALMTDKRIRHLPVMDGDKIVGVVSIGDVVKEAISDREHMIHGLENFLVVHELPT